MNQRSTIQLKIFYINHKRQLKRDKTEDKVSQKLPQKIQGVSMFCTPRIENFLEENVLRYRKGVSIKIILNYTGRLFFATTDLSIFKAKPLHIARCTACHYTGRLSQLSLF